MKTSCKNFEVFDFKEEGEDSEFASRFIKSRMENIHSVDKCTFLQRVAPEASIPSKEIAGVNCIDVDVVKDGRNGDRAILCSPVEAEDDPSTKRMPLLDDFRPVSSAFAEQLSESRRHKLEFRIIFSGEEDRAAAEEASPGNQLSCAIADSLSSGEAVDIVSDDVSSRERFSSTSSDIVEDDAFLDRLSSARCIGGCEMDIEDATCVFYPDSTVYCGRYWTDSVVMFSSRGLETKVSNDYSEETCEIRWAIDDIVSIESHWYERIAMAYVKIRVLPRDSIQTEDVDGTSGTKELEFAVADSGWYDKREAITSLNFKYKSLWSNMLEFGAERRFGISVLGHDEEFFPRYFPNFDEPFEDVVYPKGDPDAVSISKRDVDLLQPGTFINDTIIDFYIKYLKSKILPEDRHRFHFFNSFFFRKLVDLDKDPSSVSEGRAAFQRVRKWTRKVNLFEKDYVFIPVNFNYHWSLLVLCHVGEVATFQVPKRSIKVPCILHMDSLKGSHTGLKNLVQSYLWEEWKERQKEDAEDVSSRFYNLRFVSLELPQQQNMFDCGLFLLHYVELFLEKAPLGFNPYEISNFSNFLNVNWFIPSEASLKRVVIQRMIYNLLENDSQEFPTTTNNDEKHAFSFLKAEADKGNDVELLSEKCMSSGACNVYGPNSQTELALLPSTLGESQCPRDPGLALRDLFEPEMHMDVQCPSSNRTETCDEFKNSVMQIEEEMGANGQSNYSSLPETTPLNEIASEDCAFPCSSRCSECTSIEGENKVTNTAPEMSISTHEDFIEEVSEKEKENENEHENEIGLVQPDLSFKEVTDQSIPSLTEASTEPIQMPDGGGNDYNGSLNSTDPSVSDSEIHRPAKKMRLSSILKDDCGVTSSLSADLHL